ncbi:NfeD family protein [Pseudomonas sp. App30]|uniref:NfeD family protein n=1 Tax=Pseudomonas sp. App30 TaxID=3068990 RepID=UPI003A813A35
MDFDWQIWIALGVALAVLELFTATFFILWFAVGAVLIGVVALVVPAVALGTQIVSWVLLSSLIALVWLKFFRKRRPETRWSVDEVLGEVGLLTVAVAPFQKGRVRFQKPILGAEEWACVADEAISAGTRVRLVKVEGGTVRVTVA